MRVELVDTKEQEEELTYPCVRQHIDAGYIVLFRTLNCGTVISGESKYFTVGHYSDNWTGATYSQTWKKPNKSILIHP